MVKNSFFAKFENDLPGTLGFHNSAVDGILGLLRDKSLRPEAKEVINALGEELNLNLKKIKAAYEKFISNMVGHPMQQEIDKQTYELFPDSVSNISKVHFIKIKIIYEWTSSFWKIADSSWNSIFSTFKVLSTYVETAELYNTIYSSYLTRVFELNIDTKTLLSRIEKKYLCKIVGAFPRDNEVLVSNLLYDEELNYDYYSLFPKDSGMGQKTVAKPFSGVPKKKTASDDFFFTEIKGTKEWNRSDSYVLFVKVDAVKAEEQKFYSSSFITLSPSDNVNINLAAAMVRKNAGYQVATRYNKMISTLLEYATTNILKKDFGNLCEDLDAFLYHIGPVVLWNIIQEDLTRRDFGNCHYVDKNNIVKFFPENIIKKHIIDFWAEKFFDIQTSRIDSYINYSKGVAKIRDIYKQLFENAASTRKRNTNDSLTLEEYLIENTGKFFGYRRAQVFRRFVNENLWGHLSEVNSVELVNRFSKK